MLQLKACIENVCFCSNDIDQKKIISAAVEFTPVNF